MLLLASLCGLVFLIPRNAEWREIHDNVVPPFYAFLLFPTDHANIYRIPGGKSAEIVGELNRAVIASKKEILNNEIKVLIDEKSYGYLNLSDLSYLPTSDESQALTKWREHLVPQGYTQGEWKREKIDTNVWRITLLLSDSKHARSEKYIFETDGASILRVRNMDSRSGVFEGALALLGLLLCVLYLIGRWMMLRIIDRKQKKPL